KIWSPFYVFNAQYFRNSGLFDLTRLEYPIKLFFTDRGVNTTFIEKQYEYRNGAVRIGAMMNDVVIDAGGCWGDTGLFFAHEVGSGGQVYTFEFIPSNLNIMRRNIEMNPELKNRITVVEHPVWETSDQILYFQDKGPGSRVTTDPDAETSGKSQTLSIDDLVQRYKINKVDFIKMDIEGAELSALKGAKQTIEEFKPKLAISIYHSISDYGTIFDYINNLNVEYEYYLDHYTIFDEETILYAEPKNS
ncbi:FkbM family methyltransferase, partial [Paenibacillus chartarius]